MVHLEMVLTATEHHHEFPRGSRYCEMRIDLAHEVFIPSGSDT